jgi:hypothetical protein
LLKCLLTIITCTETKLSLVCTHELHQMKFYKSTGFMVTILFSKFTLYLHRLGHFVLSVATYLIISWDLTLVNYFSLFFRSFFYFL